MTDKNEIAIKNFKAACETLRYWKRIAASRLKEMERLEKLLADADLRMNEDVKDIEIIATAQGDLLVKITFDDGDIYEGWVEKQ